MTGGEYNMSREVRIFQRSKLHNKEILERFGESLDIFLDFFLAESKLLITLLLNCGERLLCICDWLFDVQ